MNSIVILDYFQVCQKIKRIAYQIYEATSDRKEVFLVGSSANGYFIAKEIAGELSSISPQKITVFSLITEYSFGKVSVQSEVSEQTYARGTVVIVDDVLNSGIKMAYCIRYVLNTSVYQIKTAVLIDRDHKKFPVKVDFKGLSLATTLQENVKVTFDKRNYKVELYSSD